VFVTWAAALRADEPAEKPEPKTLTLVVMDPLALPLSCPCVKGYAQRRYEELAADLERRVACRIKLIFNESLSSALKAEAAGRADLIIGKRSVVEFDAKRSAIDVTPLAALTGKDGATTQRGLIVVPAADPAKTVADLTGYRLIFGPAECNEKHAAALALLQENGVETPAELETAAACDEGATKILEAGTDFRGAAVISSYAKPLLEGCGQVPKGALRVVGETRPVPFVVAFAGDSVDEADRARLLKALLDGGKSPALRIALETKSGFVPLADADEERTPRSESGGKAAKRKPAAGASSSSDWNSWRGPHRDGLAPWLPASLPATPAIRWQRRLSNQALAGVAANGRFVVVADRDTSDQRDVFRCLNAADGTEAWVLRYPAPGRLDYGNSPRATPLIDSELVYVFGAFGHLHCVELATGAVKWKKDVTRMFRVMDERPWGMASSPLIVDEKLIVNPGGKSAALVALEPRSGKLLWQTPGEPAAFGSFIVGHFGGRRQLVGYDKASLGGWDIESGERLWRLAPPRPNDFNVSTPIAAGGRLLVTSENNGTRLYDFTAGGQIVPAPAADYAELAPDCHTPVVAGGRLFGVDDGLHCLDLAAGLKRIWLNEDSAFSTYSTVIAAPGRLLVTTQDGELFLFDTRADDSAPLARLRVFEGDSGVYSHPALVGSSLYVRGSTAICCLELAD
jgi:outer membrane protein assembly factor BamB